MPWDQEGSRCVLSSGRDLSVEGGDQVMFPVQMFFPGSQGWESRPGVTSCVLDWLLGSAGNNWLWKWWQGLRVWRNSRGTHSYYKEMFYMKYSNWLGANWSTWQWCLEVPSTCFPAFRLSSYLKYSLSTVSYIIIFDQLFLKWIPICWSKPNSPNCQVVGISHRHLQETRYGMFQFRLKNWVFTCLEKNGLHPELFTAVVSFPSLRSWLKSSPSRILPWSK